ncbi:MAG: glycine--tRNA ligase [bacterium]|nr:glycine--tRNA ligase [bacterium]
MVKTPDRRKASKAGSTGTTMDALVSLAKRRGFVYPGSDIYGGLANAWDYGPLGAELKNNIKRLWWERFVHRHDDIVGLDAAIIMNPKVWAASGHLSGFADQLVDCRNCKERFRADHVGADHIGTDAACPNCGKKGAFTKPRKFNLMFKTFIGPAEDEAHVAYLRPETAQGMFVDYKQVLDSTRVKLPFGMAQIGKAFRNEITPGNFIFRTREFEQMEIEYFFAPPASDAAWQEIFEQWRAEILAWIKQVGIDPARVHEVEVGDGERAHYSKRTVDFEFDFPFGQEELYGLAYRTNFDLSAHGKASNEQLTYTDPETKQSFVPHCIEPSMGLDRTLLALLVSAYRQDGERVYLALPPAVAPYKAAVFPLLRNKPELIKKARAVYEALRKDFYVMWDDRGNIGKRYYAQDEIGTPVGLTVDFDTLKDDTVTWRDRDTAGQERVKVSELAARLSKLISGASD